MKMQTDEKVINYIKRKIKDSCNIVAVLGIEMLVEGGGYDLDSNTENYRVEEEYGFSPEDMLATSFFNAKVEKFYRFYKKEILGMDVHSTSAYDTLIKLQKQGKLSAVISQNFHGLPQNVNLKHVIDLNGNLHNNKCPRCNKEFDLKYIKDSEGIPLCDCCKIAVRPGIRLLGERVDTELMTEAAIACEAADVLLILGKNMYNDRLEYSSAPEHEQLKVLFSKDEFIKNKKVDFVIRDDICEFLPLIID
ncbi:MAG: hypothetical protein K1W41_04225 [Lachnospiraceae bacterium]